MKSRKRWSFGLSSALVVVVLAFGSAAALPRLQAWLTGKASRPEKLATAVVRRCDMSVTLTTGGRVESAERTVVECELERLELSVKGQALTGGGASTVLSVVPDGSVVQKGDILCELDASEYVEMLRQQKMTVQRAEADHRQVELDLDVARMSVTEFQEGTLFEAMKELKGLIALNESTWERNRDRLLWARRMIVKGYVPISQLSSEQINEQRSAFLLKKSRTEFEVFRDYTAPRALRMLEGDVRAAEAMLNYQDQRLQRHIDRREMLELQVERCTIRAPHDGFVIYAVEDQRPIRIEEGMVVRQKQNLFYLPNLNKMLAMAMVHESVSGRVKPGMPARIRIEGLPGQLLEGRVVSVAHLPTQNALNDVRYFYTAVAIDSVPAGLRPGMTAEVEIATDLRHDVLTIPIEALGIEKGEDVCYVVDEDGIERREIVIGQSTEGLLEVTEGLEEGEQVVVYPGSFDERLETLSPFPTSYEARWGEARGN